MTPDWQVVLPMTLYSTVSGSNPILRLRRELTASSGDFEFEDGRDVELKGLSGLHRVYPVTWTDAPARTR